MSSKTTKESGSSSQSAPPGIVATTEICNTTEIINKTISYAKERGYSIILAAHVYVSDDDLVWVLSDDESTNLPGIHFSENDVFDVALTTYLEQIKWYVVLQPFAARVTTSFQVKRNGTGSAYIAVIVPGNFYEPEPPKGVMISGHMSMSTVHPMVFRAMALMNSKRYTNTVDFTEMFRCAALLNSHPSKSGHQIHVPAVTAPEPSKIIDDRTFYVKPEHLQQLGDNYRKELAPRVKDPVNMGMLVAIPEDHLTDIGKRTVKDYFDSATKAMEDLDIQAKDIKAQWDSSDTMQIESDKLIERANEGMLTQAESSTKRSKNHTSHNVGRSVGRENTSSGAAKKHAGQKK
jgi:hypothetical protein